LRIVSGEQFAAAQGKLVKRQRSTSGQARSADLIRPFTGHLYCEHCGSAFYSRKSENRKGVYVYYQCGCRQRRGPESCGNTATFREDKLLSSLQEICARAFSDIDAMAIEATKQAEQLAQVNRIEADRLRGLIAQVDREISSASGLLVDPDVLADPLAKKAILRTASELEGRREALQASLGLLLDKVNDDTGRLVKIVRAKLLEAKERWEAVASPAQLNEMIGKLVGPSIVTSDGRLLAVDQTKNPAHVDDVHGVIAGGGFEPPTSGL
jgi:hypothetical protein